MQRCCELNACFWWDELLSNTLSFNVPAEEKQNAVAPVKASEVLIVGPLLSFPLCLQTETLKIFDHVRLQLVFRVVVPAGERQGFRPRRCPFWDIKKLLERVCAADRQREASSALFHTNC